MNERAPEGQIFVCGACGKTARWRYGWDDDQKSDPEKSHGWDASCMSNSVLCYAEKVERDGVVGWETVADGDGADG